MDYYELDFTVPSPRNSTTLVEFSPDGRFLAVGDGDSSLHILDGLAGFHLAISTTTLAKPTALVWETSKSLYVGLSDGRFTHYEIDLGGNKLVKGPTNGLFHGGFPTTAIALDVGSRTLVMSVGPEVFAFRRICTTGKPYLLADQPNELMWLEMTSTSSATSRAVSILLATPETRRRFQDQFVSSPKTRLSSHFAGET